MKTGTTEGSGSGSHSSRREPIPRSKTSRPGPQKQQGSGRRARVRRTPVTKEWDDTFGRHNKKYRLRQGTEACFDPDSNCVIYKGDGLQHDGRSVLGASDTLYIVDRDMITRRENVSAHPYCYENWGPSHPRRLHDIFAINEAMNVDQINIIIRSDQEGLYMQVVRDIAPGVAVHLAIAPPRLDFTQKNTIVSLHK